MATTKYERNMVNALISNMRVTVIELGLWFDSTRTGRPKGMIRSHYRKAIDACRVAANISKKLDNYQRWDLMGEVESVVMTDRHRTIIADLEYRGFDFQEFLSDAISCSDVGYKF
ncbi:hypothetical protein NIAMH_3 [Serratia phage vB_SmaS_Niamh]|uniref:Uncharacterized protein n=1 Tax=Serratia phage vB_SmaS_Ulliraptor TaxID=2902694 RepID=A0AC61TNV1_9CAUD|nr:hypothetical protein QJS27_gp03 [Serratia phage vB_SmaS_Ulliraptor]QPX74421.1 hypothetical protein SERRATIANATOR_65 [Serratia phage vB_SmaS_Serratianator]UGO51995.1 hypothetical protein ULLIRAPTOR_3 [Serratia phage vB_SmaS_Ulliraptor]UGO52957.1 hypothetical protein NIAMH_3 [Serratia phage vB_SmaS_Niamh]